MLPLDGFTALHDPLQARVLLLDSKGTRIALAVIDLTSIGGETVTAFKAIVAETTQTDPANVWIVASHTFSAPHVFGGRGTAEAGSARYKAAVEAALRQASAEAARSAQPAQIAFASGISDANVNRNVPMADGWWLGANDAGPSDKAVTTLRIETADKRPIAVLLNYAVQSSVMDQTGGAGGSKGVTSDLGGAAAAHIEKLLGDGSVALFLTGAAGDQVPDLTAVRNVYDKDGHFARADIGEAGYPLVALQGERLAAQALRATGPAAASATTLAVVNGAVTLSAQDRPRSLGQIKPSRSYVYPLQGTSQAPYSLLRIGDVALVGVQVELNAATGLEIKRRSPFAQTIIVTMVNGAAKYMPDADGYRDITYQAMNSSYAPGSAEILADRIITDLRRLRRTKPR